MNLVKGHLDSIFNVTYSSIYRTPAEGFVGEDFFNSVCKFETDKDPYEIRSLLKQIEKNMGRTKEQKGMSSRVIDLDLILYGDLIINDQELELPSLDIEKYKFVLEPLSEIAPTLIHPVLDKSYLDLLNAL
jgi:2-amino-4-hydroxy-6-hydroxymethyldihydropteridine diphosphokinase